MSALALEDVNEYAPNVHYYVPNEDTLAWRELLKDVPVYRAAGICSSGEVGLFGMLPLVRKELVLVDHSYRSLACAAAKYLAIRELGWQEVQRVYTSGDHEEIKALVAKVKHLLPEKLNKAFDPTPDRFEHVGERKNPEVMGVTNAKTIATEWKRYPNRVLYRCSTKLDRVSFLHGDLSDLAAKGPFNVLYISNAHEHFTRNGDRPLLKQIAEVVKPGGYVIATAWPAAKAAGWEIVKEHKEKPVPFVPGGAPRNYELFTSFNWNHVLYRVPKAA